MPDLNWLQTKMLLEMFKSPGYRMITRPLKYKPTTMDSLVDLGLVQKMPDGGTITVEGLEVLRYHVRNLDNVAYMNRRIDEAHRQIANDDTKHQPSKAANL